MIDSCSTIGPKRQRREEREATNDHDDADYQADEQPSGGREVPADAGTDFLATSEPAIAMVGMIIKNRPMNIATAPVTL